MQCFFLMATSCKVPRLRSSFAVLGLLSCNNDSWRRCTCTNVLLVCEGEVGELVQPCEDCLELCFVGLVVGRICVW